MEITVPNEASLSLQGWKAERGPLTHVGFTVWGSIPVGFPPVWQEITLSLGSG